MSTVIPAPMNSARRSTGISSDSVNEHAPSVADRETALRGLPNHDPWGSYIIFSICFSRERHMMSNTWQKSSYSNAEGANNCLELATGIDGLRHLRESDAPETVLTTSATRLRAFLLGAKAGEFDHLT
ncbi:DUF397 domain-containing protein [Kitasatospora sp. NPDC091335]|uniref:DUF397 domain-containing protein n=1 Tax=Kitasatospora sp. NPDC091335 TaxID=3364085 RepID=UPI00382A8EE5